MKRFLIFILIFFILFDYFSFSVYADDSSFSILVNYSVRSSGQIYKVSNTSNDYRIYYIPMSDVLNSSFFIEKKSSGSTNLTLRSYGYSDLVPDAGVFLSGTVFDDSLLHLDYKTSSDTVDCTDLFHSFYNSSYNYLVLCFYNLNNFRSWNIISVPLSTPIPSLSPSPSPTVQPSPSPTSVPPYNPEDGGSLDDYTFWSTCYDQTWKADSSASLVMQRYVPSNFTDFSDVVFNRVYTYPIRIPFHVQASGFSGTGLVDLYYNFDFAYKLMGFPSDTIGTMVDFSTPWIASDDSGISFNAVGNSKYGYGFDAFNVSLNNGISGTFYYCIDMYVSCTASHSFTNFSNYVDVSISNVYFNVTRSSFVSSAPTGSVLDSINQGIQEGNAQDKLYHDEEIAETERAIENMQDSVGELTDTLSKWEIITLPLKVSGDLIDAVVNGSGDTGITFPSFSLMGYQLWPSYTFDLSVIEEKFPLLIKVLHAISGVLIVVYFVDYLWLKWHLFIGGEEALLEYGPGTHLWTD
ncbi:MAG: hypothetical protein NC548_48790 [Lachnospiraceae bacterium]|nr:hypothetical protein [Lachnospiraceae bacterium]